MTLTITLPGLGKPETVKDAVISILAKEWPLSTKKLHNDVRGLGITATYQAVHKALRELERGGVIKRAGKDYRIDEKWVETILKFGEEAKKAYSNGASSNGRNGDSNNLTLHSMYEVDKFIGDFTQRLGNLTCDNKPKLCMQWCHYWIPLFLERELYSKLKELVFLVDLYSIVTSDTPIDRWCSEFWKKTDTHQKIILNTNNTNFIVFGDMVLQIFYPEFLVKELDRIYSSAKKIEDLDIDELFDKVFLRKTIIPVTINRNPMLAEQLRKQVIGYFKEKA